jgi:hypothetical protein
MRREGRLYEQTEDGEGCGVEMQNGEGRVGVRRVGGGLEDNLAERGCI